MRSTEPHYKKITCIHQWHRRLGNRDPGTIKRLADAKLATEVQLTTCSYNVICECCSKIDPYFPEENHRGKGPVRFVHSNLCGQMQKATPNGQIYFLTIYCSAFSQVKIEVVGILQEYIARMHTRFVRKPDAIGNEYVLQELENFLQKKGIQHQLTVPSTTQQNDVAERKNTTLTNLQNACCWVLDLEIVTEERQF